jgi:hypothetical protein
MGEEVLARARSDGGAFAAKERNPLAPGGAHVGALVDSRERLELAAGSNVPDARVAIGAERREPRAVRAEPGSNDAAAMGTLRRSAVIIPVAPQANTIRLRKPAALAGVARSARHALATVDRSQLGSPR